MSRLPDASPHNRAEFQAQREIGRKASADLLADQQAEARAYACPECSAERAAHAETRLQLEMAVKLVRELIEWQGVAHHYDCDNKTDDLEDCTTSDCLRKDLAERVNELMKPHHSDPPVILPVLRQAEAAITALLARPERQPSGAALYPLWVMIDGREIAALETALAALRKITGGQS